MWRAERRTTEWCRLLDGGREAYPAMLEAIHAARREIFLEVYQFAPDGVGDEFITALSAAARRGVRVEVVIDGFGSAPFASEVVTALEAAGCHTRIFGRLSHVLAGRLRRNHRKILAVDGERAFVGGINISDLYGALHGTPDDRPWADLAVEIRGGVAAWLQERSRRRRGHGPPGPVRVWLSGVGGSRRLRQRYVKSFGAARRTIDLAQGYFLPDRRVVRSITAAARRGVEVRIVVAGSSDVAFFPPATRRLYRRLLRAGVRVSEWSRSVLHAKAAAIDGERFLVGSFNLDPLSIANREVLAEIGERAIAGEGQAWIRARFDEGEEITLEGLGRGSWHVRVLLDWLGGLFTSAMRRLGARLSAEVRRSGRDKEKGTR